MSTSIAIASESSTAKSSPSTQLKKPYKNKHRVITVRLSAELHKLLRDEARNCEMSMNTLCEIAFYRELNRLSGVDYSREIESAIADNNRRIGIEDRSNEAAVA